jgi:hypothetical protein
MWWQGEKIPARAKNSSYEIACLIIFNFLLPGLLSFQTPDN